MKTCICLQNPISFVWLLNHHNSLIPLTDLQHQDSHFPDLFTQYSEILQVKNSSCEVPKCKDKDYYLYTPDASSSCLLGYFPRERFFHKATPFLTTHLGHLQIGPFTETFSKLITHCALLCPILWQIKFCLYRL